VIVIHKNNVTARYQNDPMNYSIATKYHQMIRSYNTLRKVSINTGNHISNVDGQEATEDFFVHCYHFKDYVKREFPPLSKTVEDFISNSFELSLCADYCNASKHAGLDKNPRSGEHFESILEHTRMDVVRDQFICSATVEIKTNRGSYKSIDIATKCIEKWNPFLRLNGINIPNP
jgi:hypothetical protein